MSGPERPISQAENPPSGIWTERLGNVCRNFNSMFVISLVRVQDFGEGRLCRRFIVEKYWSIRIL